MQVDKNKPQWHSWGREDLRRLQPSKNVDDLLDNVLPTLIGIYAIGKENPGRQRSNMPAAERVDGSRQTHDDPSPVKWDDQWKLLCGEMSDDGGRLIVHMALAPQRGQSGKIGAWDDITGVAPDAKVAKIMFLEALQAAKRRCDYLRKKLPFRT